ncbi:MAG TPA: DUF4242 domain-containing protein [Polyangiaceae bacterium]
MQYSVIFVCVFGSMACDRHETKIETPKIASVAAASTASPTPAAAAKGPTSAGVASKKLFLDVHELGRGKVTAEAVADAHRQDLATEAKYGVDFKAYWVDEKEGKIYCLAEAPSAEAAAAVHKAAHGLLANKIMEVTEDNSTWAPTPGKKLFLDVHHLGAGKATAKDVAGVHAKDLATQAKHHVSYLNYWFDEASGTVMCLVEAPSAEAAVAVHKEAHGLVADSIEEVSEGR